MSRFLKISILVDNPDSWFNQYLQALFAIIRRYDPKYSFYRDVKRIKKGDLLFILSCNHILTRRQLAMHTHNIVVHASDLPKGRGWSPWTWEVEKGFNRIPITLFEASPECDAGDYYLKGVVRLDGTELIEDIGKKIAGKIILMLSRFLKSFPAVKPRSQRGRPTYYPRRTREDNELDIAKNIRSQFNKLRVADNERYPAYFIYKNKKYILKIYNFTRGIQHMPSDPLRRKSVLK